MLNSAMYNDLLNLHLIKSKITLIKINNFLSNQNTRVLTYSNKSRVFIYTFRFINGFMDLQKKKRWFNVFIN